MPRINHLAIVVEDLETALGFWRDALGLPLGSVSRNDGEEVDIAFLALGESEIELLSPINETSGIARYLAKRGAGMHHVCLEVDDLVVTMARLREHGVELLNDMPKINDEGTQYCFIHPKSASGVLVELYQLKTAHKADAR